MLRKLAAIVVAVGAACFMAAPANASTAKQQVNLCTTPNLVANKIYDSGSGSYARLWETQPSGGGPEIATGVFYQAGIPQTYYCEAVDTASSPMSGTTGYEIIDNANGFCLTVDASYPNEPGYIITEQQCHSGGGQASQDFDIATGYWPGTLSSPVWAHNEWAQAHLSGGASGYNCLGFNGTAWSAVIEYCNNTNALGNDLWAG